MEAEVHGTLPNIPRDIQIDMPDFNELYTRTGTGYRFFFSLIYYNFYHHLSKILFIFMLQKNIDLIRDTKLN